jgi:hypothetical protein
MDTTTDTPGTDAKRPYRTPELRDLGSLADMTQTATGPNEDNTSPATYGTS